MLADDSAAAVLGNSITDDGATAPTGTTASWAISHGVCMSVGERKSPFGSSSYDSPEREPARQTVNASIRESGESDGVIAAAAALRDPANPSRLLPLADPGDHLHPNEVGHRMIAEAVDLALFRYSTEKR